MNVFKKVFLIVLAIGFFLLPNIIWAQSKNAVELDLFFSPTCGHCASERIFLDKLASVYPQVNISRFDISQSGVPDKLNRFYKDFNVSSSQYGLVPATFIIVNSMPTQYYIGFSDNIGVEIRNKLDLYLAGFTEQKDNQVDGEVKRNFNVPIIGDINIKSLSPLALSMLVGILDGFNACAMVALGMLLTILISTGVRKKVIIIGGTFILASGMVYFLFISAWLNLFIFIGYYKWITIIVAVLAILFALSLLKEYVYGVVCKICDVSLDDNENWFTKTQKQLFGKLTVLLTKDTSIWVIIFGVVVVAVGINMIELFCSIGFPLAYTKILTGYGLSTFSYYGNLLVYILFYMLDDFLIFIIAIFTLKVTRVGDRYLKIAKLISAIVLLLLGLVLLFKPEVLALI